MNFNNDDVMFFVPVTAFISLFVGMVLNGLGLSMILAAFVVIFSYIGLLYFCLTHIDWFF